MHYETVKKSEDHQHLFRYSDLLTNEKVLEIEKKKNLMHDWNLCTMKRFVLKHMYEYYAINNTFKSFIITNILLLYLVNLVQNLLNS